MGQRRKRKIGKSGKEKDDDTDSKDADKPISSPAENEAFFDQYMAAFCPEPGNNSHGQAFQKFVAAGGEKCIKFFQSLFNSWKESGTLPPLSEDEATMLNQMYKLWLENNHNKKGVEDVRIKSAGNSAVKSSTPMKMSSNAIEPQQNPSGSITVTLAALKEMVSVHNNEVLTTLVSQMEILLKAPEPTRTQARELLEILLSIEFSKRDFMLLERRADDGDPSFALAMAIIHETNVEATKRCVKLYLQAANKENSIASMQLGSKYLRGDGVRADNKVAFRWYMRAANLENPIAQHKLGYFYDEGLEGACEVNIAEAVRCYSRASELMPDSMHNLAKIYEDGRGNIQADMKQAVTLYSVAAARGFPLSQVNLGRLFLLGEDGVRRDREAGKRLLTLAAESGDCDAQMVVGMIHATAAFQCCDLPLAEHWLRQSLAGGKGDAERLLVRVCQQMQHASLPSLELGLPQVSQDSKAAMQRGHDFLTHGLVHAAILEFTRAFVLDRSQLSPLVDRLEALSVIGHHDDCLADCLELLASHAPTSSHGGKKVKNTVIAATPSLPNPPPSSGKQIEVLLTPSTAPNELTPVLSGELLNRVYIVLAGNIMETHGHSPSHPPSTTPMAVPNFDVFKDMTPPHRGPVIGHLLCKLLDVTAGTAAAQAASKSAAFLCRLTALGKRQCKLVVRQGGVPLIVAALLSTQNLFDHSLPAQQQITILPCLLPLWCDATGVIVNVTKHLGVASLVTSADGLSALVRLSRRAMPHARVASAALQALGNLAVLAEDARAWAELTAVGTKDAFLSALSIPMDDLADLPASAKEAEGRAKGQGGRWQERRDRLELLVVAVVTLGRVLQVAQGSMGQWGPGGLARDLAMSSAVASLQLLFRSTILPSGLRATTAFVLYKLLCALDPGASQMLKDPESRAEVRHQLQEQHLQGKIKVDPSHLRTPGSTGSSVVDQMFNRISRSLAGHPDGDTDFDKDAPAPDILSREQKARLLVCYSVDVSRASLELPASAGVGAGTAASSAGLGLGLGGGTGTKSEVADKPKASSAVGSPSPSSRIASNAKDAVGSKVDGQESGTGGAGGGGKHIGSKTTVTSSSSSISQDNNTSKAQAVAEKSKGR